MRQPKKNAGRFRKRLDLELDRSRLDGTNREDDINALLKGHEKAADRRYDRFKDRKSVSGAVWSVSATPPVRIDRFVTPRHAPGGRTERDWAAVRQDLRQLAKAYNDSWQRWQALPVVLPV